MGHEMPDASAQRLPHEPPDWLARQTREQQAAAPYCGLGFERGALPAELIGILQDKLRAGAGLFRPEEKIREIDTEDPGFLPALCYEDHSFNAALADTLRPLHEAWSGRELVESACYGFRAYQRGSYLHNHVDRGMTHIISSTICVDARLEEPWPLFIEDIYGEGHEVNLEPGEFIYYEGARLIHGRPWPLVGDYYVGMFVHYRPVGSGQQP